MQDFRQYNPAAATTTNVAVMNTYMSSVYRWMFAGVGITALVAYFVANSPSLLQLFFANKLAMYALMFAPFILVIAISAGIQKMSSTTASMLFLLYSVLNGAMFSFIFIIYTSGSIATTFLTAAGMFGAMSVYGYATKKDLTSIGSFCMMGLIGVIIASVVNLFLHNAMLDYVVSFIGVIVFVGLTAYDTQKLRRFGDNAPTDNPEAFRRGVILGALTLYLDFINLFLMLLRLMGNRK